jgi:AcrR family transcriptional regulator
VVQETNARRGRRRTFEDVQVFRLTTRILVSEGLGSLTLQRIAKEIGVTHQAISNRFSSKVGLLESYASWFADMAEHDRAALREQVTSPLETARRFLVQPLNPQLFGHEKNNPNVGWIIIMLELQREPALAEMVSIQNQRTVQAIGDLLSAAQELGEVGPCNSLRLAELALAAVSGAVVQWIFTPTGDIRERLIECRDAVLDPFIAAR